MKEIMIRKLLCREFDTRQVDQCKLCQRACLDPDRLDAAVGGFRRHNAAFPALERAEIGKPRPGN
jgi:hypothetical protein